VSGAHTWRGQRVAFLTQHGKEAVVGPLLRDAFGVEVERVTGVDTDTLGTFTREVPRAGTQLEAARRKAGLALERSGLALGLGSEGAFGPGPLGWVAWDVEVLVWLDAARGLEVVGTAHGPAQHAHATASTWRDVEAFAARAGFPAHALVMRPDGEDGAPVQKGLVDAAALRATFDASLAASRTARVFLENDLRAHVNPTRRSVIAAAGRDLVERLQRCCPRCAAPGFGVVARLPGLACRECGAPTPEARGAQLRCVACAFCVEEAWTPDAGADPARCPACNP